MRIATRNHLATATTLLVIGLIAGALLWATQEVDDASHQRRQTTAISQGLTELRLVTFDYLLNRQERARLQWYAASNRIDRLIAENHFVEAEQKEILIGLRARRAAAARLFGELTSHSPGNGAQPPGNESQRQFETQLLTRLSIDQQDSQADAFRLTEISTQRIHDAQQGVVAAILAGLALIAMITATGSWRIHHDVLEPITRLRRTALETASGNLACTFDVGRADEIGDLSKHLAAMTASQRRYLGRIELSNSQLANLNQELEAFSYSASHDLRAPLRSMDGFALVLLQDYGDKLGTEGQDALLRIRAASKRMGMLIDDLLRLAHVTRAELNLTSVNLSALARQIADSLEREQPQRPVQWNIEPGLTILADKPLIEIVMQNLLSNAFKFTSKTAHAVIGVGAGQRNGRRMFFVSDNGAGFDMAHARQLFGAFQRLHRASDFAGTGVGLAIVQRILRRHGGQIMADAKEGAGATFFFDVKDPGDEPD